MKIEHSELLCEFVSLWFETKIDGVLRYETFYDYPNRWYIVNAAERPDFPDGKWKILLTGEWPACSSDKESVAYIAQIIESAIRSNEI